MQTDEGSAGMKICDECGVKPANIHLTQIMQNETQVSHLCEACARKKGISVVLNEGQAEAEAEDAPQEAEKNCCRCGLAYSRFRSKGWLGCGDCYQSFEHEIDELLLQVHGSLEHKGKRYPAMAPVSKTPRDVKKLRHELALAIKNEEFEHAATIRDAIHSMKKMGVQ